MLHFKCGNSKNTNDVLLSVRIYNAIVPPTNKWK